ncbi:hypothetical protein EV361DRAFT_918430 [Lentinula raphanica]|nr:hypothetical protein FB446DRAFT_745608 [Lentinula raphanica]KAJ3969939.1 hypothetical protein EV361DRAFT_918430 [Lentinula raphanica]
MRILMIFSTFRCWVLTDAVQPSLEHDSGMFIGKWRVPVRLFKREHTPQSRCRSQDTPPATISQLLLQPSSQVPQFQVPRRDYKAALRHSRLCDCFLIFHDCVIILRMYRLLTSTWKHVIHIS